MNVPRLLAAVSVTLFLASFCDSPSCAVQPGEGFIDVPGGKVWYRAIGIGDKTPIVILHGGPGVPSYYLKPLEALSDERPVIFYDQLGCGHSPAPDDTTLWRVERFVAELEAVREKLGIEHMYLYGHSWGNMLASEYYFKHPTRVNGMIFAGPALDISLWVKDANTLLATLPDSVQEIIKLNDKMGTYTDQAYMDAVMVYYRRYLSRKLPWPADLDSTFAQLGQSVYGYMCGPSEFNVSGTLRTFDCTDRLAAIQVPVLFTIGEYDEVTSPTAKHYQSLLPGSELKVIKGSGHLSTQDEPQETIKVTREFLRKIEKP